MKKSVKNNISLFCYTMVMFYTIGCKVSHKDPAPTANDGSFLPGTTCILSEIKYFDLNTDSLIAGTQFEYSSGNKLSNLLSYKKNQKPGENGYTTLLYNSDGTLSEIISYRPAGTEIISLGPLSDTLNYDESSGTSKYSYSNGKLSHIEYGGDLKSVFIDSIAFTDSPSFSFKYYDDGNLQAQILKYNTTLNGIVTENIDSTVYENYFSNRPKNIVNFNKSISHLSDTASIIEVSLSSYQYFQYDGNGNKVKIGYLFFPDSIKGKVNGLPFSDLELLSDSVHTDAEFSFDITKPNINYAFRFLNPQFPDDIDKNLLVSAKIECIVLNNNYTFNTIGVPDKSYASVSLDAACGSGSLSDEIKKQLASLVPTNNTYVKYYYTGCK